MTNVQLLVLAQATAGAAVTGAMTALATVKASVAAFETSTNPDTDWPAFQQNFSRELQSYRQAAQKDAQPAVAGTAGPGGLPPAVLARLPAAMQQRLAAANAAAAPVVAAPAAPVAAVVPPA